MITISRKEQHKILYNQIAEFVPDMEFMNYGYVSPEAMLRSVHPHSERFSLELYRHVIDKINFKDCVVLEVGCGRGGGAVYVMNNFAPKLLVGTDLSEKNIEMSRTRYAKVGLRFCLCDAEILTFPDQCFNVVLNIESSNYYDNRQRFFAEVYRVLDVGGWFLYADLLESEDNPTKEIISSGLIIIHHEDITHNVLQALQLDSHRKERIIDFKIPELYRAWYKNWAGIKDYSVYQKLKDRQLVYSLIRARKL